MRLTAAEPAASLTPLALAAGGVQLDAAVVTPDHAPVELGLDREASHVESNVAAAGGSATDL